jgi:hypothetical protein
MIVDVVFWVVIAGICGGWFLAYRFGYHAGREDAELGQSFPAVPPAEYMDVPDLEPDSWDRWLQETVTAAPERLADTGELARLYTPGPTTGELRLLSEGGAMDAIRAENAAFLASLEEDGS